MLGFSALNFNTSSIIDCYNTVNDKKNDTIATVIANRRANKDRVSATAIGATFGLAQSVAFAGVYAGAKVFPKTQKFFPVRWAFNKVNEWIKIAQKNNPNASMLHNISVGVLSKSLWAIGTCALTGFLFDMYSNTVSRKLNGKFSNVKQGYQEDSWLLSGLKSFANTKQGKKVIRDSMEATDDGVKIKLKGVNREYHVSKKEIKAASKEYVTIFDGNKVKTYKKNYSSGDGDVLAFEIALKKYQSDLRNGKIAANSSLPKCANQFSSKDNLSDTELSQLYYFLTGKEPVEISNNLFAAGENSKLNGFIEEFSKNSDNMAAGFKFKDGGTGSLKVNTKGAKNVDFSSDKTYAIKKITDKYVTFTDARNTAVPIQMPISEFQQKVEKVYFTDL